jgi:hypothetical protein
MPKAIRVEADERSRGKTFAAAVCKYCGAKLYPPKSLKPHLRRHRLMQRWFNSEIKKLQETIAHMRSF